MFAFAFAFAFTFVLLLTNYYTAAEFTVVMGFPLTHGTHFARILLTHKMKINK